MEMVNGYQCKDCTDVAYAQKHIDPKHPKDGPYGVLAKDDPARANDPAVKFGGALGNLTPAAVSAANGAASPGYVNTTAGQKLDVTV